MGLSTSPFQCLKLSDNLIKIAEPIKAFFAEVALEKKKEKGQTKPSFPLFQMDDYFENLEQPITSTITNDKEFKFEEASGIHISTVWDTDLPPPIANAITILELPNNKSVFVINKDNPKYNAVIKATRIKISAKIETIPKGKELSYKGYKLLIRPKVS